MADVRAELARLYDQHRRMPFPRGLRGADIAGVCMVMVDADAAGCASAWLANNGDISEDTICYAARCLDDLTSVVPVFADPRSERCRPCAAHYCSRLREMVRLIILEVAADVVRP